MAAVGAISLVEIFHGVETIVLQYGDPKALLALKPKAPELSDREWLLLAGKFGVKEAYVHCFVEYWKRRGGGNIERLFAEWIEEAEPDPHYAPVEVFIS